MRLRVSLIFLVHGLVVGTWVSRIPAIQTALKLSPGTFGLTLLAAALGSIVAMPVAGRLIDREGSGRLTMLAMFVFCCSLPLLAFAPNEWCLAGALFVCGAAAGSMDVGMNTQAVVLEESYGRSIMSSFHALFSAGGMGGSAIGGLIASLGIAPLRHYIGASVILIILGFASTRKLIEDRQHEATPSPLPVRIPKAVVGLAAIAFTFFLSEGAMADWSAIYLREFLAAGPGTAAMGYAAFSITMAIGRMLGDAVIQRLGRRRTLEWFSLIAAAGLSIALAAHTIWLALVGFAMVGAGCCVIVPVAFAAAGRVQGLSRGVAMAAVTGVGYLGLVLGPPLIGFAAQATTLRTALVLVVVLCASGALLARGVKESE